MGYTVNSIYVLGTELFNNVYWIFQYFISAIIEHTKNPFITFSKLVIIVDQQS
jgi:hypothetical protein